jgi:hypothetical protein
MIGAPAIDETPRPQCRDFSLLRPRCGALEPSAYKHVARVSLEDTPMNAVIYIVGLVVIIGLVLGFLGLR